MRIVFVGAVEGSKVALEALVRTGLVPKLVVTLPHEASDRHSDFVDITLSAEAAGSAVLRTTDINAPATLDTIGAVTPDLCLVIGWSQLCRAPFRSIALLGNVGFHPGPLPRFRGRAVIPWTILMNERTTASTLFWLDNGVDSGAILLQRFFSVAENETARALYTKHTTTLAEILPEGMMLILAGAAPRISQDHEQATYCAKRTPDDGLIDWRQPAQSVLRLIRAVGDPYPGAFTFHAGEKLFIDSANIVPHSERFIGLTGQVQCHTELGFAVRCGDGVCIDVQAWRWRSGGRPKIHGKLVGVC